MSPEETVSNQPKSVTANRLGIHDLARLSVRAFYVRPMRTFLTILGMSVGIGTVFFLISLGYGLQFILLGKLAPTNDSLISLDAYYPSEDGIVITAEDLKAISSLPEADIISPVAEYTAEVVGDNLSGSVIAKVIDSNYFKLSGLEPTIGDASSFGAGSAVLTSNALKLLDWPIEESVLSRRTDVILLEQSGVHPAVAREVKSLSVSGVVVDDAEAPLVYVPLQSLPEDNSPKVFNRMFIKADDIKVIEPLRDRLVGKGFLVSARIDLVNQARKITTIITVVLGVFGVTALIVSSIGMFNTMLISFMERIFEVGIMKSIGATQKDIRNLFLSESLVMGIAGGVGGILLGLICGQLFNFGINILARNLGGKPVALFVYPVYFIMLVVVLSGIVGVLSGYWPARKAAKLSAREAFLRK